jgi:hypothetical protein
LLSREQRQQATPTYDIGAKDSEATPTVCTLEVMDSGGTRLVLRPILLLAWGRQLPRKSQLIKRICRPRSTRIHTRAQSLVDSGTNRDFVSTHFVERHNLRSSAALTPMNVALADDKWLRQLARRQDAGLRSKHAASGAGPPQHAGGVAGQAETG